MAATAILDFTFYFRFSDVQCILVGYMFPESFIEIGQFDSKGASIHRNTLSNLKPEVGQNSEISISPLLCMGHFEGPRPPPNLNRFPSHYIGFTCLSRRLKYCKVSMGGVDSLNCIEPSAVRRKGLQKTQVTWPQMNHFRSRSIVMTSSSLNTRYLHNRPVICNAV